MLFPLVRKRLQSLPPHWWILALIPIGLDGGTQLVGPLYQVLPPWGLTGFAVVVGVGLTVMLYKNHVSHWQYYLFVLCFPLAMGFVHLTGPRLSIWQLRTLTGTIFGLANVWLVFPMLEESFAEIRRDFADRFGG